MNTINKNNVSEHIQNYIDNKDFFEALALVSRFKVSGWTITKSRAINKYGISKESIENLNHVLVANPYYRKAGDMKLYLIAEVLNQVNQ